MQNEDPRIAYVLEHPQFRNILRDTNGYAIFIRLKDKAKLKMVDGATWQSAIFDAAIILREQDNADT